MSDASVEKLFDAIADMVFSEYTDAEVGGHIQPDGVRVLTIRIGDDVGGGFTEEQTENNLQGRYV